MDGAQALPAGPASQCARRTTLRKPMVPLCPPTPEGDGSNIEEDKSERLQTSFKAFHRASQPGPEAFLSNAVERADDLILSMECEQLLSSADDVMRVAGQPPTSCLRRIPRAVARKSLALACTALAPDLVERDRLRTKAGDLLALLLGNTKTYLEELAPLRSRIRTMDERKFKQATADVCRLEIPAAVYQWDPLLSLPESIQTLAVGVILEKLRCLITQSPLTTIAELTAWSKKMQSRIVELESAKSSTEEELAESRRRLMELDRSLAAQSTRNKELEKECHQAKFLRKQMEAAREEAQRERDRADAVEAELKQMRAKIVNADEARRLEEDLDRQRQSNKKLEQMLVDMRHADAKRQLQARSCAERLCSQNWRRSVEESDARHLSEVMRRGVTDIISSSLEEKDSGTWLQTVTERASNLCYQLEIAREREAAQREVLDGKLTGADSRIRKLEMDLGQERMVNSVTEDRCQQLEFELTQSAYKELNDRFEEYVQDNGSNKERLGQLEVEVSELREELSLVKHALEEAESELVMRRETMEQMRRALDDAGAHIYHPARVAELRAELRNAQHEAQAALNANAALRGALDIVRSKLASPGPSRRPKVQEEEIRYLLDTCNRRVHERLYEDAMRRQTREFTFFRGDRAPSPLTPDASRSMSPAPTARPCRVASRDKVNEDAEERIVDMWHHHSLGTPQRIAQLRNLHFLYSTVDDFPLRTQSCMCRCRSEPTTLPDLVNLRQMLMETVKDKTGRLEQALVSDHAPLAERPPKSTRRSPTWKGSSASPTPTHSRSPSQLQGKTGDDLMRNTMERSYSPSDEQTDSFLDYHPRRCGNATKEDPCNASSCPPTATPSDRMSQSCWSPAGPTSSSTPRLELLSPDLRWGGMASPPSQSEEPPGVLVGSSADASRVDEKEQPQDHELAPLWPADDAPEDADPTKLLPAVRPNQGSTRPKQLSTATTAECDASVNGVEITAMPAAAPVHVNSPGNRHSSVSSFAPVGMLPSSRPRSAVAKAVTPLRADRDGSFPLGVALPQSVASVAEGVAALRALASPSGIRSFARRSTSDRGKANRSFVPVDPLGAGGKMSPVAGRSSRRHDRSWTPRK